MLSRLRSAVLREVPKAHAALEACWHPSAKLQLPLRPNVRSCSSSDARGASPAVVASPGPAPKKYNLRPLSKDDVEFSFARSAGAGGQNVNKVNTKVDMRFDLDKQPWIPEEVKDEIRRAEKNKFTKEGILVMTSQKHRTQVQNIDDALSKLQEVLDNAVIAVTPKEIDPETIKRVQNSIKAGKERRLDAKKKDSAKKKERSRRDWD